MTGRTTTLLLLAIVGLGGLNACAREDPRLKKLSKGISRDSVLAVMGIEKPHRIDPFLVNGQYIEAMYFARSGARGTDSVPDRKMAPVIVIDGALVGWGWNQWDSIAGANRIEVSR